MSDGSNGDTSARDVSIVDTTASDALDDSARDIAAIDAGGTDSGGDGGAPACAILPPVPASAINVRNAPYNARGDGIADDTDAIQHAVMAAPLGGTVYVPDGTYMIRATGTNPSVRLKSDVTLQMSSGATLAAIPNASGNYAIIDIRNVSNVNVFGGTVLGERTAHTGTTGEWGMGVSIVDSMHVSVRGVTSRECWGDGFYITGSTGAGSTDVTLCGCSSLHNRRQGLSITWADNILVDSCTFADTEGTDPQAGIDLEPNAGETLTHVVIRNSQLLRNLDGMVFTRGASMCTIESSTISNNRHRGVVFSAPANAPTGNSANGCTISGNGDLGVLLKSAGNIVSDCDVTDNVSTGIWDEASVDWTNGDAQNNVIRDNRALRNGHDGIALDYVLNNTVTGNTVTDNGQHGIYLSDAHGNTVANNTVTHNGQAMDLASNNIHVSYSNMNTFRGNTCRMGAGPNRPAYGLDVNDHGSTGNQVIDNDLLTSGSTANLRDLGTGTVLMGNMN